MKSRKRLSKLPEEWEVIPDTHEGIVTQEEFDTVQRLMTSRRREENAGGFKNIFAGIIKCADCGYALRATSVHRRKRPDIIDCVQYSCNNYARNGSISGSFNIACAIPTRRFMPPDRLEIFFFFTSESERMSNK